tara:strand:- start:395 stop:583 length:189 start_codon:yes stop_codon:yes gene_type:complete
MASVFCSVDVSDLAYSLEIETIIFNMLRKGAMLSFKIRVNCDKSGVEKQKTQEFSTEQPLIM